jgi:DNA-binding protein HU-beta
MYEKRRTDRRIRETYGDVGRVAANVAVNTLIEIITRRLKKGDTAGITGFGGQRKVIRRAA